MRKLTPVEESALRVLSRHGSFCPGSENDPSRQMVRSVLDSLVRKKRVVVEDTDDGPRYTLIPGMADAS